jgi:branched-chain amino acid transport system substrate-binding protein
MKRSVLLRTAAAASALALVLAACGDGDDAEVVDEPDAAETDEDEPDDEELAIDRPGRDDKLDFGYILPETGPLAFLGAPQITAAQMAVDDINAAGGVNGQDVTMAAGDEAGDAAVARDTAARHINAGVDAVIGAAASGMSQEFIQLLHDNEIVQCSGSNTSPAFTDQDNNTYYFRTVPPDEAVAPIIADTIVGDGASNIAVVARADDYGVALADLVEAGIEGLGANVATRVDYDPNATDFSAEVSDVVGANADAIALIAFGEGATFIRQAIEEGVGADQIYGSDGLFGPTLTADVNPDDESFIAGMRVIGAAGGEEFNNQLAENLPAGEEGNFIYGGQVYDCVVVTALAAIAADSVDPAVFNQSIPDVTKDGTECTTFAECKDLLEAGEDVDYVGASGPIELEHPDPTFGRYAVGQFQDDGSLEIIGDQDVDLAEVG